MSMALPPVLAKPAVPKFFDLSDGAAPATARVNAVGYGNSGVGKTSLFTALNWGTERWGNKAIYVAWDAGSETLLSVSPEDREHLVVVTPKPQRNAQTGRLVFNPYKAAMEIANADWATLVPEAKTLIWDGGTRLAEQILRAVANTGATVSQRKKDDGSDTRLTFGEKGDPDYMALPIIPDYGMAQNSIMQWAECLRQQPLNILVICVSDYYQPEGGSQDDTVGGPCLVGTKIIPKFMKDFDNIFRLSIEPETVKVETKDPVTGKPGAPTFERINKRVLWTEKHGIWDAKIRRPPSAVNPLARVELTTDRRAFWKSFDASGLGVQE
jgi:hypothetical protein